MEHNDIGRNGHGIVALVADLMFASRIRAAAPAAKTVHQARALLDAMGPRTRLVLVDLHASGAVDAIRAVREAGGDARLVAFGSHVETGALAAAKEAGADSVLARSGFVKRLPELVREAGEG